MYGAAHLIYPPAPGSETNMKPATKRTLLWSQHRHTKAASRGSQEAEGWVSLPGWPPGSRQAERVLRPGWPAGGLDRKHDPATQLLLFEPVFNVGKSLCSLFRGGKTRGRFCPGKYPAPLQEYSCPSPPSLRILGTTVHRQNNAAFAYSLD